MRFTIPALLAATIMVAGAFAFMPVEQATTVHTTITDNVDTMRIGITTYDSNGSIADVGDIAQDVADTFGATDDGIPTDGSLVAQGRITVTQSANTPGQCDIDVTVTDVGGDLRTIITDARVITGATLDDVGFFSINLDPMVSSIDISVATDGTTADTDCDNVGLDLDTNFKVLRTG